MAKFAFEAGNFVLRRTGPDRCDALAQQSRPEMLAILINAGSKRMHRPDILTPNTLSKLQILYDTVSSAHHSSLTHCPVILSEYS